MTGTVGPIGLCTQELSAINAKPTRAYDFIVVSSPRSDRIDCKPCPNNGPVWWLDVEPLCRGWLDHMIPRLCQRAELRWSPTPIVADHSRSVTARRAHADANIRHSRWRLNSSVVQASPVHQPR